MQLKNIKKISNLTYLICLFFFIAIPFANKLSQLNMALLIPFIFIPLSLVSSVYVFKQLVFFFKGKKYVLWVSSTILSALAYKISDTVCSSFIFDVFGYNPIYLPHTYLWLSIFYLIYSWAFLFSIFFLLSILISVTLETFPVSNFRYDITFWGSMIPLVLCLSILDIPDGYKTQMDNLAKAIAITSDYHSVKNSALICDEAKDYDFFNYLKDDFISVSNKNSFYNKQSFHKVISCKTT